jgi:Family of unknown function (DUF6350)
VRFGMGGDLASGERIGQRGLVAGGWRSAILRGLEAIGIVVVVSEAVAFLLKAGGLLPDASLLDVAREGGVLFYLFHHVGIEVISPNFTLPSGAELVAGVPSAYPVDITLAAAFMGGTLLVLWLLYRAGRITGRAAGGTPVHRGVHGAKVALPYAAVSWAGSWFLGFRPSFPDTAPLTVHPSHVASLFWPLALGLAAGFVGGLRSSQGGLWSSDWWQTDTWSRRWRGVLAGGAWMAATAGVLAVAGILGLAVVRPHDVAAYFGTVFSGSILGGVALICMTALVLPNMAVWLLIPAMGGCLQVGGSGVYRAYCFVGYTAFPGHPLGGLNGPSGYPRLGDAPPAFLLFALIPLAAVLIGGAIAARRADVRTRGEGLVVGATAGVVFALLLVVAAGLASVTARFNGPLSQVATGYWQFGPNPAASFQLGLAWGMLGGALGGMLGSSRVVRPSS